MVVGLDVLQRALEAHTGDAVARFELTHDVDGPAIVVSGRNVEADQVRRPADRERSHQKHRVDLRVVKVEIDA